MTFNPPPKLFEKVMRFKLLKYDKDKLLLWGVPCSILPYRTKLYWHKLMEKEFGLAETNAVLYHTAKFQVQIGVSIVNKRFGYAESIADKKKLLEFNIGQMNLLGFGTFKFSRMDIKNKEFIITGKSPEAEEHRKFFGIHKHPVDYFIGGIWAGGISLIMDEEMVAIETECFAKGDKHCTFLIKPKKAWDMKKIKDYDKKLFEPLPEIKGLVDKGKINTKLMN